MSKGYSQTDVGRSLNNAVAAAFGAPGLKIDEPRKKKLRMYLTGVLDAVLEHRKDGVLTADELVAVLASGALFVHVLLVTKRGARRLPMFEDIAVEIAQDLDETE